MKLYKIYAGKLTWSDVVKETICFYFLDSSIPAFGYSTRIDKKEAMLTPQEAILEALNSRKTMRRAFQDKLSKIEIELESLKVMRKEYNQSADEFDAVKQAQVIRNR